MAKCGRRRLDHGTCDLTFINSKISYLQAYK